MARMDAIHHGLSSSLDDERDDQTGFGSRQITYETPFKSTITRAFTTPGTVTEMTPSPMRISFSQSVSATPGTEPLRAPEPSPPSHVSFLAVQRGFLHDDELATNLFQGPSPPESRRKRRSFPDKRSRLSHSLLLEGYTSPRLSRGMERRRSVTSNKVKSLGNTPSPENPSRHLASIRGLPKGSPDQRSHTSPRNLSSTSFEILSQQAKPRGRSTNLLWVVLVISLCCSLEMIFLTSSAVQIDHIHEPSRPDAPLSTAGLRGQMTSGHWEDRNQESHRRVQKATKTTKEKDSANHHKHSKQDLKDAKIKTNNLPAHDGTAADKAKHSTANKSAPTNKYSPSSFPEIHLPPPASIPKKPLFEIQDRHMYSTHSSGSHRVVALDPVHRVTSGGPPRSVKLYPADFTDNTQLYSILDSSDERLGRMEPREPYSDGECVPMQEWQTTFHPSCNGMHEIAIASLGEEQGNNFELFGTKGFWRYAWKLDAPTVHEKDTMVLKTLKFNHNFEDAHFEHDRVDAVAMERLTSSPHVINVFGFCGHSALSEYADGPSVGELADKSKRKVLARLKIASDIAHGVADVHGIDGDGNATFVHLDVNPANVVSIDGTLKLNDFNIGIIRRWNITSNTPCGFPAQYPNPQWRSPEEARNEQNLTEKVDVFSMGHIFFRLICGHEPWNKLEPGGRPSREEITAKVQRGDLPFIPDFVQNSDDPEIIAIRDAMLSCYTFDPRKRPSARDVANALDKALGELGYLASQQNIEETV